MDREPRHWPGVGTGEFTLDKLMCVDGWLDMLTKMSWGVLQKNEYMARRYSVIDLNAGPGRYLLSDGRPVDGTPLLILRRLADSRFQMWRAAGVEQKPAMAEELRFWLAEEAAKRDVDRLSRRGNTKCAELLRQAQQGYPGIFVKALWRTVFSRTRPVSEAYCAGGLCRIWPWR